MALNNLHCAVCAIAACILFGTTASASLKISSKPTQNVTCAAGVCSATANKAVLNVSDLASMLASGDVAVQSGSIAKDMEIDAALSWSSTHKLTLDSYRSITFNRPVVVAGTAALTIVTNDGGSGGDFRFFGKGHVEFWDLASDLIINGKKYILENKISRIQRNVRHNGNDNFALAKSIDEKNHSYTASPIGGLGGTFEGLGNTISNLTIDNTSGSDQIGLFYETVVTGIIRDLNLVSVAINGRNARSVGSLAGIASGGTSAVKNVYAQGQIFGGPESYVGGLVGKNLLSLVSNSRSDVSVSGSDGAAGVGGLVGLLLGRQPSWAIENSFATGTVMGGQNTQVGGLVGSNSGGIVMNSYATGQVTGGNNSTVGGLIGTNVDGEGEPPLVSASYSTGGVSGGTGATVGGLIGQDVADSDVTDTYWDLDTSGISDLHQGAGNIADDPGITGLTTGQFKSGLPAGFSPAIWKEKAKVNSGYPYLIANPPAK
jgi:hypothetical protein